MQKAKSGKTKSGMTVLELVYEHINYKQHDINV